MVLALEQQERLFATAGPSRPASAPADPDAESLLKVRRGWDFIRTPSSHREW